MNAFRRVKPYLLLLAALIAAAAAFQWTSNAGLFSAGFAAATGALIGAGVFWAVRWGLDSECPAGEECFARLTWTLVISACGLRLLYMGLINLIPEEAYYWKYAQNLDYGYLDHPPWVALTIYLGGLLAGTSELGARIGAFFWWGVAGFFIYRFSRLIYDRKGAALGALAMWSLLPLYFAAGFFVSPDSPMVAFWAASIYFLYRALVLEEQRLWWAAGICLGLGMLAKYPIALLGPATLAFMLIDPNARRQFSSPRPYLAALAALICFSPVILWNMEHGWASFVFQSVQRVKQETEFSLPSLLAFLLLTLMPTGVYVLGLAIGRWWRALRGNVTVSRLTCLSLRPATERFIAAYVLTPLLVFFFFSLTKEVKVNWLGPVFIPFLPVLGASWAEVFEGKSLFAGRMRRAWLAVFAVAFFGFGLFFVYLGVDIPGVPYSVKTHKFLAGRELAREVLKLEDSIAKDTGRRPVVVALDRHYLASQLGFYRAVLMKDPPPEPTSGRHLIGRTSLMHSFWDNPADYAGRDMILVSRNPADLEDRRTVSFFDRVDPLKSIITRRNGYPSYELFYRVGRNYVIPPAPAAGQTP